MAKEDKEMEMSNWEIFLSAAGGLVTALGGFEFIKYLVNIKSNRRMTEANADIKEIEKDERELGVMKQLVESLQQRIEQQIVKRKILCPQYRKRLGPVLNKVEKVTQTCKE